MADFFADPRSMLKRAKHHLANLEAQITSFAHEKPTDLVEQTGGMIERKIQLSKGLGDLPNIVFDCVSNLRAALDQMAYAIGAKHMGHHPKSAKFPFGSLERDMLNNLAGGCTDLPEQIRDLFKAFAPYKGGNDHLWALNELRNTPMHRMLYPVRARVRGVMLRGPLTPGARIEGGPVEFLWDWNSEKSEVVYARYPSATRFYGGMNFHLNMTLAFDDVDEVIRRQHPVDVLRAMTDEVQRVLVATEDECRRIGLIS